MIITLLSDFGQQDNFVGISKGILLTTNPDAKLIDITHEVTPTLLLQCSYLLHSAYNQFPQNTIHVSLFDILHDVPANILITKLDNQFIISADNGLLPHTFDNQLGKVYKYKEQAKNYVEWIKFVGNLIHELEESNFELNNLEEWEPSVIKTRLKPVVKDNQIECQVIHIDRFGNVVLNIRERQFEELRAGRKFKLTLPPNEVITEIKSYYRDVSEGEKLCLFNTAGYLEIAINKGNAAPLFGLSVFKERDVVYRNIKIEFENIENI